MKITRKIAVPSKQGTKYVDREFELTRQEVLEAYNEKSAEYITEDVMKQFEELCDTEDLLGVTWEELSADSAAMNIIIKKIMFKEVDEGYWYFIDEQIRSAVKRIRGVEE